jgi:hypothetical protein
MALMEEAVINLFVIGIRLSLGKQLYHLIELGERLSRCCFISFIRYKGESIKIGVSFSVQSSFFSFCEEQTYPVDTL